MDSNTIYVSILVGVGAVLLWFGLVMYFRDLGDLIACLVNKEDGQGEIGTAVTLIVFGIILLNIGTSLLTPLVINP